MKSCHGLQLDVYTVFIHLSRNTVFLASIYKSKCRIWMRDDENGANRASLELNYIASGSNTLYEVNMAFQSMYNILWKPVIFVPDDSCLVAETTQMLLSCLALAHST